MKYNVFGILFLLSLCALYACSDSSEVISPEVNLPKDKFAIEFNYSLPSSDNVQTRANDTDPGESFERSIQHLEAFIFKANNEIIGHFSTGDNLHALDTKIRLIIKNNEIEKYSEQNLKIYLVANYEFTTDINNLTELLAATHEFKSDESTPSSFIMDGYLSINKIVWPSNSAISEISEKLKLTRAAAKIRFNLTQIEIKENMNGSDTEYEVDGVPEFRLVNYARKTKVIETEVKSSFELFETVYKELAPQSGNAYSAPNIYSYESDWSLNDSFDADRQAYLLVKLPLRAKDRNGILGEVKNYFYKVLISPNYSTSGLSIAERASLNKIKRNYLYKTSASIHLLGSEDESTPLEIKGSVKIEPWVHVDIEGDIEAAHYLQVKEQNVIMPNTEKISIQYYSDLEVEIVDKMTRFETYNNDGTITVKENPNPNNIVITPTAKENKLYIDVVTTDGIPKNYVPLNIYFTVRHKDSSSNLSVKVHIIQYPAKYITAEVSMGFVNSKATDPYADFRFHNTLGIVYEGSNNSEESSQKNKLLFKVTTLVPAKDDIIGDPQDGSGKTLDDQEANKIISPEFIIASQYGLSQNVIQRPDDSKIVLGWIDVIFGDGFGPIDGHNKLSPYTSQLTSNKEGVYYNYSNAEDRCATYFEDEYGMNGTYTEYYIEENTLAKKSREIYKEFKYQGKWRLPTAAELEYINLIQADSYSAVKRLLWGPAYWTALKDNTFDFITKVLNKNETEAAVRCVFDTWKIEDYE